MGKQKFYTGIAVGAAVGGLIALLDADARYYAKHKVKSVSRQTAYCIKHPSESVRNARHAVHQFNEKFIHGADNTINALEQVEETIDKFTKKEPKKLEGPM